jgi:hypothetical protein
MSYYDIDSILTDAEVRSWEHPTLPSLKRPELTEPAAENSLHLPS